MSCARPHLRSRANGHKGDALSSLQTIYCLGVGVRAQPQHAASGKRAALWWRRRTDRARRPEQVSCTHTPPSEGMLSPTIHMYLPHPIPHPIPQRSPNPIPTPPNTPPIDLKHTPAGGHATLRRRGASRSRRERDEEGGAWCPRLRWSGRRRRRLAASCLAR